MDILSAPAGILDVLKFKITVPFKSWWSLSADKATKQKELDRLASHTEPLTNAEDASVLQLLITILAQNVPSEAALAENPAHDVWSNLGAKHAQTIAAARLISEEEWVV